MGERKSGAKKLYPDTSWTYLPLDTRTAANSVEDSKIDRDDAKLFIPGHKLKLARKPHVSRTPLPPHTPIKYRILAQALSY